MSDVATGTIHPLATEHLPFFVTSPGQTDVLFVGTALFLVLAVVGIGVFYFRLHALPEQMAHRGQKVQFEIVAVLGLLSLFTHNHLFWIAGLLLALVPLPDLSTPLRSMAQSLGRMAGDPAASQAAPAAPPAGPVDVPVDMHPVDESAEGDPAQVAPDERRTRSVVES